MKSNQKGNHLYAYKDTIRRLFLLTLFSFLIVESYAQNKTISGTVTDFTGEPVIGASVLVNGTTNGTITDLNGKFSLSNVPTKGTITITYIGYKKQEVSVAGNTNFKITLQEDTETLDEVVVVGYGVQKKSDVTGAMARVGEKELKAMPVRNALEGMQGKTAGVDITSSQRPGEVGNINIRGQRSINAEQGPLYVVDGMVIQNGGIENINPSDIVAIEECDIFIYNGGESDEWVENVLDSLENKNITVLKMTDYVSLLNEKNPDHTDGDEADEHIWTSVRNAEQLVKKISDVVTEKDNKNKSEYENNTNQYLLSLDELDKEFTDVVNNKKRDTVVFGDRFPFLYFMTDYGLNYECAFPGCSSETEPSLEVETRLIDYVRDNNIPVVFHLEMSNGKIAQLIGDDTGAEILQFSSCHNITKDEFNNGEDYISVMKQNCSALKEALS